MQFAYPPFYISFLFVIIVPRYFNSPTSSKFPSFVIKRPFPLYNEYLFITYFYCSLLFLLFLFSSSFFIVIRKLLTLILCPLYRVPGSTLSITNFKIRAQNNMKCHVLSYLFGQGIKIQSIFTI